MASEDNPEIFSDHIMNATADIRNGQKRPYNNLFRKIIQPMPILTSSRKLLKNLSKIKRL